MTKYAVRKNLIISDTICKCNIPEEKQLTETEKVESTGLCGQYLLSGEAGFLVKTAVREWVDVSVAEQKSGYYWGWNTTHKQVMDSGDHND